MGIIRYLENMALSGAERIALEERMLQTKEVNLEKIGSRIQKIETKIPLQEDGENLIIPTHKVTTNHASALGKNDLGILQINPFSVEDPHKTCIGFNPLEDKSPREKLIGGGAKVIVIEMDGCRVIGVNRPAEGKMHPVQDASGVTFYRSKAGTLYIGLHITDGNTSVIVDKDELTPAQKDKYIVQEKRGDRDLKVLGESEFYSTLGARNSSESIIRGPAEAARYLVEYFIAEREEQGKNAPKGGATFQGARIVLPAPQTKRPATIELACLGIDNANSATGEGDLGEAAFINTSDKNIQPIPIHASPSFDLSHDPVRARYGLDDIQPMATQLLGKNCFIMTSDGLSFQPGIEQKLASILASKNADDIIKEFANKETFTQLFKKSYDDGTCWIVQPTEYIEKVLKSGNKLNETLQEQVIQLQPILKSADLAILEQLEEINSFITLTEKWLQGLEKEKEKPIVQGFIEKKIDEVQEYIEQKNRILQEQEALNIYKSLITKESVTKIYSAAIYVETVTSIRQLSTEITSERVSLALTNLITALNGHPVESKIDSEAVNAIFEIFTINELFKSTSSLQNALQAWIKSPTGKNSEKLKGNLEKKLPLKKLSKIIDAAMSKKPIAKMPETVRVQDLLSKLKEAQELFGDYSHEKDPSESVTLRTLHK